MSTLPGWLGPLVIFFGLAGAVWGIAADRIAARWPADEDEAVGSDPAAHKDGFARKDDAVRKIDWRTIVVVAFGLLALAAVPIRFGDTPERLLFGAFFAALVLLLATDLDRRFVPDLITLPLIAVGLAVLVWGGNSLVNRSPAWPAIALAVAIPLAILVLSLPWGAGAFGLGDVKLLMGSGLLIGAVRMLLMLFATAVLISVIVPLLLLFRRVGRRTFIPLGPFFIIAVVWVALLPAAS